MADTPDADEAAKASSKLPLILGLVFAVLGGAGGFYAVYSGLLLSAGVEASKPAPAPTVSDVAFVEIAPIVISLGPTGNVRHLRFGAQLEVAKGHEEAVRSHIPRIVDVLNGYLRAVDMADLEDPSALVRLRAQMLRRVQIVAGEGSVRDLLIMEFVLT